MNKLGNWNNIKDCLPIGGRLVLLKTREDYDFIFARLYQFNYGNNEVTFIPEKDEEYFNISNERIKNAKTKGE